MKRLMKSLLLACSLMLSPLAAEAQDAAYPTGPVSVIIAFGPGTGGDFLTRLVAERLSEQMNATFVVDNRPGAGGATGTKAAAEATPDGHTLLLASNATLIINPTVNSVTDYDGKADFAAIGTIARTPMILVTANTDSAPKSLEELLERARAGTVNYASTGKGAFGHLTTETLLRQAGITATNIPYRSSSESLTDVMRGEVLFAHDSVAAALPMIRNGQLRALAVTGDTPLGALPDVPTYTDAGIEGMGVIVWYSLMAPAGTPQPILDTLQAELVKIQKDPAVIERLKEREFDPFAVNGSEFEAFFDEELKFWQEFASRS